MPDACLITAARACLAESDPAAKCRLSRDAFDALQAGRLAVEPAAAGQAQDAPGRPSRPELVPPRDLPRRRLGSPEGQAALVHAIAHIEFNAINLAWDAVARFAGMPPDYYRDWARVAAEEAYHFGLLRERLQELGYDYGDFPAHNGLWSMALATAHDVLVRMALVPRVLEARGLDVTPGMMQRLREAGDERTVALLEIILHDEIGHVEIGTRWYRYCCARCGVEPEARFQALIREYIPGGVRGPFHLEARRQAGFSDTELAGLEALDRIFT
ncbi:hypothetical protein TspCOW1_10720 [Thiohalobacter sp. COW1]|uniref:Ferritin-like domain-containing protein n=1 Tax=Thiohalobacter thiocyanaticus TaxID=585455 RepID=A0A1Z4VR49_9GAMM|nr:MULTISPECIES: ferritin-like domain-containing protein [Thiohalobacter]BAZ93963.1 uncharacterized protein FOKN1_1568 [Thiohalobacter thiocyanaticus]BCO30969.1 hypothetical protein TspCOW1_10720 [Thiohalobacter sp. COW1]